MTKILPYEEAAELYTKFEQITKVHAQLDMSEYVQTRFTAVFEWVEVSVESSEYGARHTIILYWPSTDVTKTYYSLTEFRDAYDLTTV